MAVMDYNFESLEDLKSQILYSPRAVKLKVIKNLERLINEAADDGSYPFDFLCWRITGYRPKGAQANLLGGRLVREDLLQMLDIISATLKQRADEFGQPVYTVEDLSRMFDVSPKTISRWRKLGLKSRKMIFNDHGLRTAFPESYVDDFIARYGSQIKRLAAIVGVSEAERREILSRARELMLTELYGFSRAVESIARELGHPREIISQIIKRHIDGVTGEEVRSDSEARERLAMASAFAQGKSIGDIVREFNKTRSAVYRAVYQVRANEALAQKFEYVYNALFDHPNADQIVLGTPLPPELSEAGEDIMPSAGAMTYSYDTRASGPLLTRDQERDLFTRYNYLKFKLVGVQEAIRDSTAKVGLARRFERLRAEALEIRRLIIRANMRLVVSIAKRHMGWRGDLASLISDGNLSLLKAIEKFDFGRGNKFSTYASWAIMKNYAKSIPEESYVADTFLTGRQKLLEASAAVEEAPGQGEREKALKNIVAEMMGVLGDREREIVSRRYGLRDRSSTATLEELGKHFGLTKERIRQIESKALKKLKQSLDAELVRGLLE